MSVEEVSGALEEYASVAKQAVDVARQAVDAARLWRRKYLTLKRRSRRVLERLQTAVAQLEEAARFGDNNRVHMRNALSILYDVIRDLEVSQE